MNGIDRLDGMVCAVTGGAQGIGYAVAKELARLGGRVAILDLNIDAATRAAERLHTDRGSEAVAVSLDVCNEASIECAFGQVGQAMSPPSILVNCAGIMTPTFLPGATMPVADFDAMLNVHVRGVFLCCRAVLPDMQKAGFGRIINISSILGILGLPNRIGYATAKTAIVGFSRSLAVETARQGITVNAVAPGYILTETLRARVKKGMIDYEGLAERAPAGRWGLPEEVAHLIGFLAQPGAGFITGAHIPVDGGYTVRGDPAEDLGPLVRMDAVETLFSVGRT